MRQIRKANAKAHFKKLSEIKRYAPVKDLQKNFRCCPKCKKIFTNRYACYDHIQAKHQHNFKEMLLPIEYIRPKDKPDYEPSMAELMVEAEIFRACGEPVEDWLSDMMN